MTAISPDVPALHLLREIAPQVLGVVARRHGDFAEAEDAVQEALIAAAEQWPVAGIPNNPRGWLYQVAMRRLTDFVRSHMLEPFEVAARKADISVAPLVLAWTPWLEKDGLLEPG